MDFDEIDDGLHHILRGFGNLSLAYAIKRMEHLTKQLQTQHDQEIATLTQRIDDLETKMDGRHDRLIGRLKERFESIEKEKSHEDNGHQRMPAS